MRRRLLILLFVLLSGLLAAVLLPLAQSYAAQRSQDFHITRLGDADWFAALSEEALRTGRLPVLREEITRYARLYDVTVVIVNIDRRPVVSSGEPVDLDDPAVAPHVNNALAGLDSGRPLTIWPWDRERYVLAEPVGHDSQVLGAVVTLSETGDVRADVRDHILLLLTLGLGVSAILALLVAVPLVRWILRPVNDLDAAAHEIARGRLDARVSPAVGPTELRGLASSFNAMAGSVGAALRQQRDFVADASHQLRNPLAALRLQVENLREHVDGDGRADLLDALDATEQLSELVDALLRLARAEATKAEQCPTDICACVDGRTTAWRTLLPDLVVDTADTVDTGGAAGRTVLARRDVVEQILDILLDNAAKFAAGSRVSVTVSRSGQDIVVQVRDGGPGLPETDLARAGERFFRSPAHQNIPGTGLGLAIAHELATHSGGRLDIANAEPTGLAVTVRLPGAPSPSPPGSSAPLPDAGQAGTSRSPSAGSAGVPPGARSGRAR
jgi:signal transduction histidine kinase